MFIAQQVALNATISQGAVAFGANDLWPSSDVSLRMARMHYIPEWAKEAGKKRTEITAELHVDKSNVSRWFKQGVIPDKDNLKPLAKFLGAPEPAALFVHPREYKILLEIRALSGNKDTAA